MVKKNLTVRVTPYISIKVTLQLPYSFNQIYYRSTISISSIPIPLYLFSYLLMSRYLIMVNSIPKEKYINK